MSPLRHYIAAVEPYCQSPRPLNADLDHIAQALRLLLATDDWLPEAYARPHPEFYQQYPLYVDEAGRFSIVSFVWGPGQATPLHDHQTWGVVGVLRGAEHSRAYQRHPHGIEAAGPEYRFGPGDIEIIRDGNDIHRVSNACPDQVSVSIHTYGTDIGRQARHTFDPVSGEAKGFVSGYALPPLLPST